jgi:phenylacetate-CoA ligase
MSTSGSTGTPFTIGQDENKRKRVLAEIIYFGELCGYCLGDRNAYLRVWTESNKKSKFGAWKQNLVMIDISKLDRINLENIRTILKRDKNLKCILGYATSLDIISKYLLEMNDSPDMFGIEVVISGAEVLNEVTRNNLKKVFNCNVVSRYSNQENGILAQELIDSNFFIINNASYYIEFLKLDSDNYAEIGEQSRMVVTDLFNYAMPMIRYDTGDLAVVEENEKYDKVIKSIEGRKVDFIYSTEGKRLSPHVITNNMWNFNKIKQYQLIQEDKSTYVLKLNCSGEIYKDDEIIGTLKRTIGEDANISIKHVEGIPFLKSGKFRTVICNYKPNETETK